ncbi:hypothetical protein BH09BAC6_BH09BAC6_23050 [soil metagenome]|jgi:hypothetical protein
MPHKQPERRTFLQDRLGILIKKQKNGTASFTELTELDDMVNADPQIRDLFIRESLGLPEPESFDDSGSIDQPFEQLIKKPRLSDRLRSLVARIFAALSGFVKINIIANRPEPLLI